MYLKQFFKKIFSRIKRTDTNPDIVAEHHEEEVLLPTKKIITKQELGIILKDLTPEPGELYNILNVISQSDRKFAEYWRERVEQSLATVNSIDHDLEYDEEDDLFINRLKTASSRTVINELNDIYIELTTRKNYYYREVVEPCEHYEKESAEYLNRDL
jgi:hypothetical protein